MLIIFTVTIAATIGILLFGVYMNSGRLFYQGTRGVRENPASIGWEFEEITLRVDSERTIAWYIPAEVSTKRTILFSHGNAGNLGDKLKSLELFRGLGVNVLAYDYGGYGDSTGTTSEMRCYADIRAVWNYATTELGIPAEQMIIFGRSLGAGPTAQLATEVQAGAVVIESAFLSVPKIIRQRKPLMPGWIFGRNRFDNESKMGEIESPVLIIHGEQDTLIPYIHGTRLYALAPEPKAFLDIHGEHHEGFWKSGEVYTDGLLAFFDQHVK